MLFNALALFILSGLVCAVHSSTVVLVAAKEINYPAIEAIFKGISSRDEQSTLLAADNVNEIIERHTTLGDSIIVLGQSLIEQITPDDIAPRIIGGAFYGSGKNPAGIPTLSLEPSLETVVSEIRKTGLALTSLRSVVSESNNIFHNDLYKRDAAKFGVELSPTVVSGERDIARAWFALLQDIDPASEAILIADEKYMDSSGAYKHVIETAWKRDILVVTTLPQYSRRGVSIGFIPDLPLYGQNLYDLLTSPEYGKSDAGTRELWTNTSMLNRVFNRRTLEHIGLSLPGDLDRLDRIDLVIK